MTLRELHDRIDWSLVDGALDHANIGKEVMPEGTTIKTWRCHLLDVALQPELGKEKVHASAKEMLRHYGIWHQMIKIMEKEGLYEEVADGDDSAERHVR